MPENIGASAPLSAPPSFPEHLQDLVGSLLTKPAKAGCHFLWRIGFCKKTAAVVSRHRRNRPLGVLTERLFRSSRGGSQCLLHLDPQVLDRLGVEAVRRQIFRPRVPDGSGSGRRFVGREIVHDDDVAVFHCGHRSSSNQARNTVSIAPRFPLEVHARPLPVQLQGADHRDDRPATGRALRHGGSVSRRKPKPLQCSAVVQERELDSDRRRVVSPTSR